MEQIHKIGYVFNDLKLDNILFDIGLDPQYLIKTNDNIFESFKVNLIDFGFATEYLDQDTGEHLRKKQLDMFRGNA